MIGEIMYIGTMTCPVCGKENEYISYSEYGIGTVESHYYCDKCTYFVEQCYSPVYEGISTDCPEEYREKIEELGIDIYRPEEVP